MPLQPENQPIAEIAWLALQPDRWGWAIEALMRETPLYTQTRSEATWRIVAAVGSKPVTDRILEKQASARAEAERKAKAAARKGRARRPRRR